MVLSRENRDLIRLNNNRARTKVRKEEEEKVEKK